MSSSRTLPENDRTVVTPAPGDGLRPFHQQRVDWSPSPDDSDVEFADIEVPVDYADPAGRRITLALSRRRALNPDRRRGVLLSVNGGPGGDGGEGIRLPDKLAGTPPHQVYDLIGFDPRGTGRSTNLEAEVTETVWQFDSRPPDSAFDAIVADMRERDAGCQRAGAWLRPHVTTNNIARDLDVIRAVLGEPKLSFIGWAYGSKVGAVYGTMFPERLDRSVLDSCVHPDWDWREQFATQATAIRENVDAWAEWVGRRHTRFGLGRSAADVLALVEDVAANLAGLSPTAMHRTLYDGLIGQLLPSRRTWADLGDYVGELAVAGAAGRAQECMDILSRQRRWRPGEAAGGRREAVLEAVTCETPWPRDLEPYFELMRVERERCPYGYGVMRVQPWVATFATYTVPEKPVPIAPRAYPKGLVVQADHDPWDYRVGAVAMAERLDNCLVEVADSGMHEVYVLGECPEVDAIVHAYLRDGVLPADRTRCRGEAPPDIPADSAA